MADTGVPTAGAAAQVPAGQAPAPTDPPADGKDGNEVPVIPPEILAIKTPAADALEVPTLRTEAEALINGVQEISSEMEQKGPEKEGEAKTLKAMLLSLKAQCAVMKASSAEVRQVGGQQLELLQQVVRGFQAQTDQLQSLSDDLGGNLLALSKGFEKLKGLYSKQRVDHQEVEGRHQKIMGMMDGQNEIFKHIRKGINTVNDALRNTNWSLEEIRSGRKEGTSGKVDAKGGCLLATINKNLVSVLELIPEASAALGNEVRLVVEETAGKVSKEWQDSRKRPIEPQVPDPVKKVKFYHPTSGKEYEGTEQERDLSMTEWWKELQSAHGGATRMTPADASGSAQEINMTSLTADGPGFIL